MRTETKKVAVILGPGGAKALAHVGVLKAFQQQRIPIDKVVGLEWGALIAALYADKGQVNDVEWKLYKMEQKGLPRPKGFFTKRLGEDTVKVMDDYLQEAFGKTEVSGARIAFGCPSRSIWTGVVTWQSRGAMRDAVRRCLPFPPLFKAQGTVLAGASQATEAVELLRREGYNVIILVNVLGSALPVAQDSLLENLNYVILWQEVKRALHETSKYGVEVVNVDTSSYPMVQFESKKELVNLGESAGQSAANQLVNKYGF
jgi:NTE family protein